jgi:uncharacterized membrane protein
VSVVPTAAAWAGAAWGLGAAGLLAGHLRAGPAWPWLAAGVAGGVIIALARPSAEAWRHPWLALLAAVAGLAMGPLPEPVFFLLVPLVSSALAWPLRSESQPERLPRAMPGWTLPATFVVGAAAFFVQSAERYWAFGAGAKDLGLFYQTHWLIAHGRPPLNTVMGMHALADHMELLDYAVAPLLRIHDSPATLLLVQALATASAVFPLAWMGQRWLESSGGGLTLAWAWLLAPDLHMGVMFDYNPTQLGAAALLWTAWALLDRALATSLLAALGACLSKENTCLYVAVIALVLAFRGASRRNALAVAALALGLFAVEMTVLFPYFRPEGFRHWEYEEVGEANPLSLLVDHPHKRRAMLQPLAATGYVGLADPISLLLQAPNWAERLLSTHRTRWWGYHYGVPAAATSVLGLMLGWRRLRRAGRDGARLPHYVVTCALLTGLLPPYRTPAGNRTSDLYRFPQPNVSPPDAVRAQREAVALIGGSPHLKVAAQNGLLPALAGRPEVYLLDRALEADVVALELDGSTWPDGRPSWKRRLRDIWGTGTFAVAFCHGETVVLRRGAPPGLPCPAWDAILRPPEETKEPEDPGP